jgi:hypothetical protein
VGVSEHATMIGMHRKCAKESRYPN